MAVTTREMPPLLVPGLATMQHSPKAYLILLLPGRPSSRKNLSLLRLLQVKQPAGRYPPLELSKSWVRSETLRKMLRVSLNVKSGRLKSNFEPPWRRMNVFAPQLKSRQASELHRLVSLAASSTAT
jgi:hypothetical protein